MAKIYFSCPKFTVLLVTEGPLIVKAAPIVQRFEGQTVAALTSWAQSQFGGPILVQKLNSAKEPEEHSEPRTHSSPCRTPILASTGNTIRQPTKQRMFPMICMNKLGTSLPYGTQDLDPRVICLGQSPRRVRCYVRGCRHVLRTPTRYEKGQPCPDHGIFCHYSSAGATFSYADAKQNAMVSPNVLGTRVIGHPFKYESHRLGAERSEDMLTWNVFRSLQEAGCLGMIARAITGDTTPIEPFLYLWGICLSEDAFDPWNLLISARRRFESNLPVERPLTEPDIALHLPGRYLILIEAKFTSPNTFYARGPRQNPQSLTLKELLEIYHDPALRILDHARACSASRVFYQLWRNTVFAEWMGREDHPKTRAFHVNLVRKGFERSSAVAFHSMVADGFKDRFRLLTWEAIYKACQNRPELSRLCQYLRNKTSHLVRAFKLG